MGGKKDEDLPQTNIPIVPVRLDRTPHRDEQSHGETASTIKRTAVVAVSIVLFFVVLTVIFVLPRYVGTDIPVADNTAADVATEDTSLAPATETHAPEEAAKLRRSNQAQLEQALELVEQLETRNVGAWAADEFDAAVAGIASGEKAYGEQRYAAAQSAYAAAIDTLQSIAARTIEVVSQVVEDGFLHIDSRDSGAAAKAFEFALSIDPAHAEAKKGLARAQTLDQVLALVNEAEGYERLNDLETALERYRGALALDGQAPGAAAAIARIKQTQVDTEFRRVMSQGFAAFDAKQDTKAKSAFERAQKLKPYATEASEALAQVENRILANRISQHLGAAIKFEQEEKWTEAAKQFRAAVSLDTDLEGAATSARRADGRAKLDQQLNSMIGRPHRLGTEEVYKEAQAVLKRARSTANAGPRLSRQIDQLDSAIEIARTPIAITLLSDNATEVTLYKVGPLGRFERHSLAIIPGRYVVVGRRNGFRDVRVEFDVSPERRDATITVRCEQKLAFGS